MSKKYNRGYADGYLAGLKDGMALGKYRPTGPIWIDPRYPQWYQPYVTCNSTKTGITGGNA